MHSLELLNLISLTVHTENIEQGMRKLDPNHYGNHMRCASVPHPPFSLKVPINLLGPPGHICVQSPDCPLLNLQCCYVFLFPGLCLSDCTVKGLVPLRRHNLRV